MYGIAGERRLEEYELDWLPGYEGSRPAFQVSRSAIPARPSVMASWSRWDGVRAGPIRNSPQPGHCTLAAPAGCGAAVPHRWQVIAASQASTSPALMRWLAWQQMQVTRTGRSQSIPS